MTCTEPRRDGSYPLIALSVLPGCMPGISLALGAAFAEAAAVCLEDQRHSSGVELALDGEHVGTFLVIWDNLHPSARDSWADMQESTEWGAYGIAALLVQAVTDLHIVARARKGTKFDFWLCARKATGDLFQNASRLEVSGILNGDSAAVSARVKQKVVQVAKGASSLPACVVVVEFGGPRSIMVTP